MTADAEAKLLVGLVRVTARDGSVWWVQSESAAAYAAIEQAVVATRTPEEQARDRAAQDSYWRKNKDTPLDKTAEL